MILFDFDGTLADTAAAYLECIERMLREMGLPPCGSDAKEKIMGPTKRDGFLKILKIPEERLDEAFAIFSRYNAEFGNAMVRVYPHMIEVLKRLKMRGNRLMVTSCKDQSELDELMPVLGLAEFFEGWVGYDAAARQIDKPSIVKAALALLGGSPGEAILAGDRYSDCAAARELGLRFAAALYGYGTEAEFPREFCAGMAHDAKELERILIAKG